MESPRIARPARVWIARAFSLVEDVLYIGLAVLISGCGLVLLVGLFAAFWSELVGGSLQGAIVHLLDRILLVLLLAELLYSVQVSFREHMVLPEPFLLVGLIATIRRVLVITAEFSEVGSKAGAEVHAFAIELGVLTAMILALSVSLYVLRGRGGLSGAAERS